MSVKTPLIAVVTSIVIPISIFAAFWNGLNQPLTEDFNSLPLEIQEIDQRLATNQPEIIFVGSSIVNKAIHEEDFAKYVGLPEGKVQTIWSGMAAMPAIALMIQNRILNKELQPKVIAIASPPSWLTNTEILQDANFTLHQTSQLTTVMAEVLGKTGEVEPIVWKQRKSDFQNNYKQLNQQLFGEQLLNNTPEKVDTALDTLFAPNNQRKGVQDSQLIQHNIRINEEDRELGINKTSHDLRLLKSIASELKKRDIHLVVVTLPVSKTVKRHYALTDTEALEIISTLKDYDASFIDFYDWTERGIYGDTKHMNKRGQTLFTNLLAKKWTEKGILTNLPEIAQASDKILKPSVTWINKKHILNSKEYFTLTFPINRSNVLITSCMSSSEPVTELIFEGSTERTGTNFLWCEKIPLSNIKKDQPIQLKNHSEHRVTIHSLKSNSSEIINIPRKISAFMDQITIENSKSIEQFSIIEPSKLSKWLLKKKEEFPNLQVAELSNYTGLSNDVMVEKSIPLHCKPVEFLLNNEVLPETSCKTVWKKSLGFCTNKGNLVIIPETPVQLSSIQVQLKSNRLCQHKSKNSGAGFWFFPGDTGSTGFNWPKGNYSRINIEGVGIGDGPWTIELEQNKNVFLKQTFSEPLNQNQTILLEKPMLTKYSKVRVRISIPEDSNTHLFVERIEVSN